jgi:hypothetical protein
MEGQEGGEAQGVADPPKSIFFSLILSHWKFQMVLKLFLKISEKPTAHRGNHC